MLANRYGRFSPTAGNGYLDAGIFSDTIKADQRFDWDWGAEALGRYDGAYKGWLQQGYVGGKAGIFYLYAGLKEEHFGTQDPELSSGFIIWSGNARPIPRISLSTFDFVKVPWTKGFIEFKAGISHGWFGNDGYVKQAYLHHKYFYLRFGGLHAFHLTAGLHHFVQWGGNSPEFGRLPSGVHDFAKVFFAHEGNDSVPGVPYNEWENRFGNHLGTKDISLDYRFNAGPEIKVYWQNFIEDITGMGFRNLSDGLWGIQFKKPDRIKIGYEFFRSMTRQLNMKNGSLQGGTDNYFNNGIYKSGWAYQGYTLGNPMITSPVLLRDPDVPGDIVNNRVAGHIVNIEYSRNRNIFSLKYSYTRNYGNTHVLFVPSRKQHSILLSCRSQLFSDKLTGIFSVAYDAGNLLGDHLGVGLALRWAVHK